MTEELKRDISQDSEVMVDNSVHNVQPLDNVEVSTSNNIESVPAQNPFMYNAELSNSPGSEVTAVTEQVVSEAVNQDITFTPADNSNTSEPVDASTTFNFGGGTDTTFTPADNTNVSEPIDASTTFNFGGATDTTFTPADNTNISEPVDASTTFAFTEQSTPVAVETPVVNNNPFMYAVESTQPVVSSENTFAYNAEPVQPQTVESSFAYATSSEVQQPVVGSDTSFAYVDQNVPTVPVEPTNDFTYSVEQPVQSVASVENNNGYAYVEPTTEPVDPATQVPTGTYDPQVNFTQENREEKSSIGFMVFFGILMLIVVLVLPYFIGYN